MNKVIIPNPLQIVMDDLGWFCGNDDRKNGGPSRTGVPRRHCPADYYAVNELGKRLDMKINCAFVLGEWDDDNRLKSVKNLSKYGDNWDNARYFDKSEMEKVVEAINSSEYIDFAVHGLLHGYYTDGIDNTDESDYYYSVNKELFIIDEQEIRHRLDCYFDLVKHHGINKNINSMVPPSFTYRWNSLSNILKDYGIKYISTIFKKMEYPGESKPVFAGVENGIITVDRNCNKVPWDAFSYDITKCEDTVGIFGVHWPNILDEISSPCPAIIDKWVEYFQRCSQNFGTILSKDMKFCATQSLYKSLSSITESYGTYTVDLSDVPILPQMQDVFYISTKQPILNHTGCELKLYETKKDFISYEIRPTKKIITFL